MLALFYKHLRAEIFKNISIYFRDLSFKKGEMIILRQKVDSNWYQGEANGVVGIFPLSYVQVSHFVMILYYD